MRRSEVNSHLQVLFRNKSNRETEALACFFTHTPQSDLFPLKVETPKAGMWQLKECQSDVQPNGLFKTWAIYSRIQPKVGDNEEDTRDIGLND